MKKLIIFVFFTLTYILCSPVFAGIVQTNNFSIVLEKLEKVKSDDLVLFDIDHVIIAQTDQIFLPQHKKDAAALYHEFIEENHSEEEIRNLKSTVLISAPIKLIDPKGREALEK